MEVSIVVAFDQISLFRGSVVVVSQLSHRHVWFFLEYHRCPLFPSISLIETKRTVGIWEILMERTNAQ